MQTFKSVIVSQIFVFLIIWFFIAGCEKDPFDADSGTFTDKRDGHEYNWVKIGEQIWMAENLAYIPVQPCAPDSQCGVWVYGYTGEGSYGTNYFTYGCLYDWETAQKVCPEGWHLPSDEEWMELERFLGMKEDEVYKEGFPRGEDFNVGGKLKETGATQWMEPNIGATNEIGFRALPGGDCFGRFMDLQTGACFWTSTETNIEDAYMRSLHYEYKGLFRHRWNKYYGLSVRYIKN